MDNQLKPCPFCGSDDTYTDSALGKRQVLCNACEAAGPTEETDGEAIASWNRLAALPSDAAGAPAAWLVTSGKKFVDKPFLSETAADRSIAERNDGARKIPLCAAPVAADAAASKNSRDVTQLADWLLTDPQTGEKLHFAGPLEPDFLRFSRVKMESKSGAVWTLSARLEEGYLTASERLENIKRAAKESEND
ncbi:Lar family restriction alleviation protein [Paraburkholderia tropica]|uniref:Lar family restriction alleviation protein n=1 Tax=Paraburkholderia tropica TaxID=92647 RepID=UPI001F358749|nr:Lar family restriction alleviation protein [Paraburkholderia tropica]